MPGTYELDILLILECILQLDIFEYMEIVQSDSGPFPCRTQTAGQASDLSGWTTSHSLSEE